MLKFEMRCKTKGLTKAIRDMAKFQEHFNSTQLIEQATEKGKLLAQDQISSLGAIYTEHLLGSLYSYVRSGEYGYIVCTAEYAPYVEFGTGIVGSALPHPEANAHDWYYDVNSHGEKGWVYMNPNDNRLHWTQGIESRPFMYNAARELENEIGHIARGVYKRS